MDKENVDKVLKDTIEYANKEIIKNKKRYLKMFCISISMIVLLILLFLLIFKYERPVKYSKDIVKVNIPMDKGIDIKINLDNYKNAKALLVRVSEDSYDLYINVTQTISTKIFKDSDKTNNLLRIGNGLIIDFQSERLQENIPNNSSADVIKHIYYIDNLSNKTKTLGDKELMEYKNKVLIWER